MIRILIAKVELDGHDRGIKVVSQWLRDAGMEVVYLGAYRTTEDVIKSAVHEDVGIIGLSFQGGQHLFFVPEVTEKMKENNLNIPLVVGGNIPSKDITKLKEIGVSEVFPANTPMAAITGRLRELGGQG